MTNLYTQNNYHLDEVISALQKDIRRANEEQALYWALELVPKFENYLWRRLCVIVNEDIGVANPLLLLIVPQQRELFIECRELGRDGSARLILANTLLLLCRSPKSRLADHFQCVVNQGRLQTELRFNIPDYALDKHTHRGHTLKRDVDHWLDEGCVLTPPAEPDLYADRARALWKSPQFRDTNWGKRKRPGKSQGDDDADQQLELF
jgi:replication-associated recombination protein RarA